MSNVPAKTGPVVTRGWATSEVQLGVGGAVSALVVSGLVAYFGVTMEQATTIAGGLVTAGALLWKVIEARRSVKESAARVAVAEIMTAPPPAAPPPASLLADPYGREGDPIDRP